MAKNRAVFWDRDDTLIHDPGYISDPDQVRLIDGAADAIRRVREAGYLSIIVTNQSGIARGLLTETQLAAVHNRLKALLVEQGATIDAIYYCPFLDGPEATVAQYRKQSDLRKPTPGMLLQAAADHDIDLGASWMVGNNSSDIQTGATAGCRTIWLSAQDTETTSSPCRPAFRVRTLIEATNCIVAYSQ